MNTDGHRFETKILRKSAYLKYIGVNLILVVLAFLAGFYFSNRGTERRQAEVASSSLVCEATAASVMPSRHTNQIASGTDPGGVADELSADDIKGLLRGLGPMNSERVYDRMEELLLALAKKDPGAAIDYVLHVLKPPFQNQALNKVLGVWAGNDGRAAWDWVKANRPEDSMLTGAVLSKIGSLQPEAAWQFATELATNRPDQAAGLYVSAMSGMTYGGKYADVARLLSSAAWPSNAPAGGLTVLLASQWGAFSPSDAAQWVQTLPEGAARSQALLALGQSWAGVDPGLEVEFASQLPSNNERVSMLEAGLNSWMASDPKAVDAWMSAISTGPDYDQMATAIANTPAIINNAPENSVAWALSISDPDLKEESVVNVFTQWFHSADGPAMNYLKQMPPEIQAIVSRRLRLRVGE